MPNAAVSPSAAASIHTAPAAEAVVTWGIVTDVHYADAPAIGTRVYRDSLPKVRQACGDISAAAADFIIELGDFKDTDVSQHCDEVPTPHCVNLTVDYLRTIDAAMSAGFAGPRYHVLGNHDVDVLNQSIVLANEANSAPMAGPGYYSWSFPPASPPAPPVGADTAGCLAIERGGGSNQGGSTVQPQADAYVWVVHPDGTRNWVQFPTAGCAARALAIGNISAFPKRHGGQGAYGLNATQSAVACAQDGSGPHCSLPLPTPLPPPLPRRQPVRFIVLNGDYTEHDEAWADLDQPFPGEAWDRANVPTFQMEWLAEQLEAANEAGQRVIVFLHYRLDGGPGGPVGQGLGPPMPPGNRPWVDDCTLQNAGVVRALLERWPGLVLATFSGHDHVPHPPWTKMTAGKPLYWTHAAMVEGHFPTNNAYSVVTLRSDCSIVVKGYGNATSAIITGPANCSLVL